MTAPHAPNRRNLLVVIILLFLAGVAWWWSLRALRVDARTAPTPTVAPPGQSVAPTPR